MKIKTVAETDESLSLSLSLFLKLFFSSLPFSSLLFFPLLFSSLLISTHVISSHFCSCPRRPSFHFSPVISDFNIIKTLLVKNLPIHLPKNKDRKKVSYDIFVVMKTKDAIRQR